MWLHRGGTKLLKGTRWLSRLICQYHNRSKQKIAANVFRGKETLYHMPTFEDAFSVSAILRQLCRMRAKLAARRERLNFLFRISTAAKHPQRLRFSIDDQMLLRMFPPRRTWNRFRPRNRSELTPVDVNAKTLYNAVRERSAHSIEPEWRKRLYEFVARVRERALALEPIAFEQPKIIAKQKKPGDSVYRPLTIFST